MGSLYFSKKIDFLYADFVSWEVIVTNYNTHSKEFLRSIIKNTYMKLVGLIQWLLIANIHVRL